jgi:hypothetical protein
MNMESPKATSQGLPDRASTLAYIDKYCKERPLESVINASLALFSSLGGARRP